MARPGNDVLKAARNDALLLERLEARIAEARALANSAQSEWEAATRRYVRLCNALAVISARVHQVPA